ncbi:MAG: alpha/beta hydrolase [Pseudomonadota bacterium]
MFERLALALLPLWLVGCATQGAGPSAHGDGVYTLAGQAPPVVFLQSGLGDGKAVWDDLMPDLARDHTVFAYDRPGHGANPPTEAPRDPCTIAREAHALLRGAGLAPPYLLVGHSLGGLYQYAFARLYPEEVAGLVLVDPTHPRHWQTMQDKAPAQAALLKALRLTFSATDRREFDDQTGCLDRLALDKPLVVPTRILVAGRLRPEEQGAYAAMQEGLRRDWLRLVPAPRLDRVLEAGHYIQRDAPTAVTAAIRSLSGKHATPLPHRTSSSKPAAPSSITPGVTDRSQVLERLGQANEVITDPDTGEEVWIYPTGLAAPWYIGFVPVLGEVVDAVETVQSLHGKEERLIRFDGRGVVQSFTARRVTD